MHQDNASIINKTNSSSKELVKFVRYDLHFDKDDAEDIVQDAIVKILELGDTSDVRYPKAYVMRMVRNKAIDFLRKKIRREKREVIMKIEPPDFKTIEDLEAPDLSPLELRFDLRRTLRHFKHEELKAILMKYAFTKKRSTEEIAEQCPSRKRKTWDDFLRKNALSRMRVLLADYKIQDVDVHKAA